MLAASHKPDFGPGLVPIPARQQTPSPCPNYQRQAVPNMTLNGAGRLLVVGVAINVISTGTPRNITTVAADNP
ncbi:hypothetical protein NKI36_23475 [Mesorhizobium caraganae]|uniref:Uncharacterized protein n=1 Tax=Mesorhizobium caraganae TaxID=483206 RepID=A0ABV1Z4Y9_9HYPH